MFDLSVDIENRVIVISEVLPAVPKDVYQDFKAFVQSHHESNLPDHRRIEKTKAHIRSVNNHGSVALRVLVKDGDYEYALQKLIHLVQETYLIFLFKAQCHDYMIEQLGFEASIG